MSFQSRLSALRENPDTARAGMKWTDSENTELMERAVQGMNIDDIAKAHMRTVTGVKARIMANALAMMESHDMTLEDASMHVHIPLEELEAYKQREDEKPKKSGIQNVQDITKQNDGDSDKTGRAWSSEEENKLIEEIKTLDVEEIANLHQRTVGGINSRLRHIGCRLLQEGMVIHDVSKMLNLSEKTLQKSMNMRKNKNATQKDETNTDMLTILREIRDLLKVIADK